MRKNVLSRFVVSGDPRVNGVIDNNQVCRDMVKRKNEEILISPSLPSWLHRRTKVSK